MDDRRDMYVTPAIPQSSYQQDYKQHGTHALIML